MHVLQRSLHVLAAIGAVALLGTGCDSSGSYEPYPGSDWYVPDTSTPQTYYPEDRVDPWLDSNGDGRWNPSPLDPYSS